MYYPTCKTKNSSETRISKLLVSTTLNKAPPAVTFLKFHSRKKPKLALFLVDMPHIALSERPVTTKEKKKCLFLKKKLLRQSHSTGNELELGRTKSLQLVELKYWTPIACVNEVYFQLLYRFTQFSPTLKHHDLCCFQRKNPVASQVWCRFDYSDFTRYRPRHDKKLLRYSSGSLELVVVPK